MVCPANLVLRILPDVLDNEDKIKSRKNCRLQINIVLCSLQTQKNPLRIYCMNKNWENYAIDKEEYKTLRSSYRPDGGLAAASTEVLEFRTVVIPAFAMEMVCCSIAS